MRLDLIRQHAWVTALVMGALLGAVAGAAPSPTPPPLSADGDKAAWSLPELASTVRGDDAEFARLRRAAMWTGGNADGATALAKWKLVGVIGEGDKRTALLMVDGQQDLLRVSNGDPLPDDGQVVDVGRFGMRINIYGCENLILRLYTPGQRAPAPGCGYADDSHIGVASAKGPGKGPGARAPGARKGQGRANRGGQRGNRPPRPTQARANAGLRPPTTNSGTNNRRPGRQTGARPAGRNASARRSPSRTAPTANP